jgi:hypothetical protein
MIQLIKPGKKMKKEVEFERVYKLPTPKGGEIQ